MQKEWTNNSVTLDPPEVGNNGVFCCDYKTVIVTLRSV